jgi:hypothetical protein
MWHYTSRFEMIALKIQSKINWRKTRRSAEHIKAKENTSKNSRWTTLIKWTNPNYARGYCCIRIIKRVWLNTQLTKCQELWLGRFINNRRQLTTKNEVLLPRYVLPCKHEVWQGKRERPTLTNYVYSCQHLIHLPQLAFQGVFHLPAFTLRFQEQKTMGDIHNEVKV